MVPSFCVLTEIAGAQWSGLEGKWFGSLFPPCLESRGFIVRRWLGGGVWCQVQGGHALCVYVCMCILGMGGPRAGEERD